MAPPRKRPSALQGAVQSLPASCGKSWDQFVPVGSDDEHELDFEARPTATRGGRRRSSVDAILEASQRREERRKPHIWALTLAVPVVLTVLFFLTTPMTKSFARKTKSFPHEPHVHGRAPTVKDHVVVLWPGLPAEVCLVRMGE